MNSIFSFKSFCFGNCLFNSCPFSTLFLFLLLIILVVNTKTRKPNTFCIRYFGIFNMNWEMIKYIVWLRDKLGFIVMETWRTTQGKFNDINHTGFLLFNMYLVKVKKGPRSKKKTSKSRNHCLRPNSVFSLLLSLSRTA